MVSESGTGGVGGHPLPGYHACMVSIPRLVAVVALVATALTAQVQKGGTPPELTFDKVWNQGPASWDDLAGKVVILDFAQTW